MSPEIRGARALSDGGEQTAFRRIAVCLDGSELGERVLPHALAVGRAFNVPLTLLRVVEGGTAGDAPADPLGWNLQRKEASDYLDSLASGCAEHPALEAQVIEGNAAEQICLWTQLHDADLTALCSHGTGGASPWRLASNARKLAERAPGSLLLVPAAAPPAKDVAHYRRILVPLDGSLRAESVIPLAVRLAEPPSGEILLAHAIPVPELTEVGPFDVEDLELRDRLVRRNERVANEYLDRLRAQLTAGGRALRAIVVKGGGDVRGRLVRLIEDMHVDLVVMSAHGHSGRTHLPYGSVTAHLMAHSSAPLLIVRSRFSSARRARSAEREYVRLPNQATR